MRGDVPVSEFAIREQFYLHGAPFQIISGGIHYFRVVPEYWEDRLMKLKVLGCNTVETYVPWNLHEPQEGQFDFSGMLDLSAFLRTAQALGLYAIVRPSPYICAEWEFGGLPAWLLAKDNMHLRSSEGDFLACVKRYYDRLLPMLAPMQIDQGHNIILMQVENEYGYYGDDKAYLAALADMMRAGGITVPLVTSDGPTDDTLRSGGIEGALPTANFGAKADERFDVLARHVQGGPLMCMEYWVGWFDHWGCGKHHVTDVAASAAGLDVILRRGSVNIYMFHGGTNFGFMNGANYYEKLTPDVTSYDYDALLTEDGQITPKYTAFQEVIGKHLPEGTVLPPVPPSAARKAYGKAALQGSVSLWDALAQLNPPTSSRHPLPMEAMRQAYGYTLYCTRMRADMAITKFRLWQANDRAHVFIGQQHMLTLYDRELLEEVEVDWHIPKGETLSVLVENMGRVNYGVRMRAQRKGIAGDVLINGRYQTEWEQYALPLDEDMLGRLSFGEEAIGNAPAFFRAPFPVDVPCDTFLDMSGFGKGCVFINGFHLGRFWDIGPQRRLYIPAPLLRAGDNECIIFETEGKRSGCVTFTDAPNLG